MPPTPDIHSQDRPVSRRIRFLIGTALMIAIFGALALQIVRHLHTVRGLDWGGHPLLLVTHAFLTAVALLFLFLGWRGVLAALGQRFTWRETAYAWLVPNLGKYLPGKVVMYAGRLEFLHRCGARRSVVSAAVIMELLLSCMAALPFLACRLAFGLQGGPTWSLTATGVVLVLSLIPLFWPRLLVVIANRCLLALRREGLAITLRPLAMLLPLSFYFLAWVAYGLAGDSLARALELPQRAGTLLTGSAFVSAWLLGFLSLITPGGLGVREGVLVVLLGPRTPAAVLAATAVAARLTWTVAEVGGALIGWLVRPRHAP